MLTDRDDIDKQLLLHAIDDAYGLGLHTIAFVPKGQEAYTYVAQAAAAAPILCACSRPKKLASSSVCIRCYTSCNATG